MGKWKITPSPAMRSMVEDVSADGKRFKLMVEFEDEGDKWCITMIEDVPAPGYDSLGDKTGDYGKGDSKGSMIDRYASERGEAGGPKTVPMNGGY